MALTPLPSAIACSGSGTSAAPSDPAQVATNTAAATDFSTVALQMSADYTQAPFYLFPTGSNGHVVVFAPTDMAVVDIIKTWAAMQ
jgi:hypothetical protein